MTASPSALALGSVIASQFRIQRMLGQGGMGSVFLADQLDMGRSVVIKVLNPELTSGNNVAVERFRREAQAVARLNHPNIVQIYVFGHTEEQQLYIAMEYVEGRDLGTVIEIGAMPQQRALRILDQVCSALIEAHSAGIVHRDLKPENIMITDRHGNPDYVKVLDFGIAKLHDQGDQPNLTKAGTVFGTPRYMAPEQARGQNADARADIYALGLILHEMLTGAHPFKATTALDYLLQHVNQPVPSVRDAYPDIQLTPRVEAIVYRCLEKDADDRYQSVAEMQREVRLAMRDFSEASRGYPSSANSAISGPARPQVVPGVASTSTAPGQTDRPARAGMPVWGWIAVGFGLSAAIVALVIASTSKSSGPQPAEIAVVAGTQGHQEGEHGADEEHPQELAKELTTQAVVNIVGADDGDDDGPAEKPEPTTTTDKPTVTTKGGVVKTKTADAKVDMEALAKRLAQMQADEAPAHEILAALSEAELLALQEFGEGGGDLDALMAKYPRPKPATTELARGKSIDGFPMPAGARATMSTPQAELFEISDPARAVLDFYKSQLRGRYELESIPNGLSIKDPDSPFTYIMLTPNGDTLLLSLTRNVLAPSTAKANTSDSDEAFFGIVIPGKINIIVKSSTAIVLRSRMELATLCNHLSKKYGNLSNVVMVNNVEDSTPTCVIANSGGNYPWQAVAVMKDPQSEGALMISISKAQ